MIYLQTLGCLWVSTFASTIFGHPFQAELQYQSQYCGWAEWEFAVVNWVNRLVRSLNLLLSMVNDVTCTFTSSFFFARYLRFTMLSGWWCLTLHDFTLFGCASRMRYQWAHCSFLQAWSHPIWGSRSMTADNWCSTTKGCDSHQFFYHLGACASANQWRERERRMTFGSCQPAKLMLCTDPVLGGWTTPKKGRRYTAGVQLWFPWRIHGAGIYANVTGVYWW